MMGRSDREIDHDTFLTVLDIAYAFNCTNVIKHYCTDKPMTKPEQVKALIKAELLLTIFYKHKRRLTNE